VPLHAASSSTLTKGIQPFARRNHALLFNLLGMARVILGFLGLKAASVKRRAPPGDRLGIGFACRRGGAVRAGFFDAQLELPISAKAIGDGLALRFAARPFEVGQAARERVSLKCGCTYLPLQLCEPGIVRERILNATDSFAGYDSGAGRCDCRSGDPSIGARITARRALITASRLTMITSC
jgi:hypothetical protein